MYDLVVKACQKGDPMVCHSEGVSDRALTLLIEFSVAEGSRRAHRGRRRTDRPLRDGILRGTRPTAHAALERLPERMDYPLVVCLCVAARMVGETSGSFGRSRPTRCAPAPSLGEGV